LKRSNNEAKAEEEKKETRGGKREGKIYKKCKKSR